MSAQITDELRPFGSRHRNVVFNAHGVGYLAAKALGDDAGPDAFAGRVNCRCRTGRTTPDNQHFVGGFRVESLGVAACRAGVEPGKNFFQTHATLAKHFAIQKHRGHSHDLPAGYFILKQRTVNRRVPDARVYHRHQVQRLHNVRAILATQ